MIYLINVIFDSSILVFLFLVTNHELVTLVREVYSKLMRSILSKRNNIEIKILIVKIYSGVIKYIKLYFLFHFCFLRLFIICHTTDGIAGG